MIQETNNERNRANRMLASLAGKVENKLNFKPICSSNSMNDCVHGSFFIFWRFFSSEFIYLPCLADFMKKHQALWPK